MTSRRIATARCVLPAPGLPRSRRPWRRSVPARNSFVHWRQTASALRVSGTGSKFSNVPPSWAEEPCTRPPRSSARRCSSTTSSVARHNSQYRSAGNVWPRRTTCSVSNSRPQPRQRAASGLLLLEAGELGIAADEGDVEVADRSVAMLRDDHFGDALLRVVGVVAVVVLLAVEEHDEVGVLLDRARLAQVGEHRPLVVALFGRAVELGERDDRKVEVLRDLLQAAGDRGHFLQAALLAAAGGHQLEVVDDHESEVRLAALQRLGAGAELEEAERRRVVDVERR